MITQEEIEFAATLAEATRDLAGESDIDRALTLITDLATESVVCEGASVTLRLAGGEFRTIAPTDLRVRKADQLQYELREGPCVSVTFEEGIFIVDDLSVDPRWPHWGPYAAELGLESILSVHLYTTKQSVGSLNLYGTHEHRYTEVDVEIAKLVAAHASAALARFRVEHDLWNAIDSRHLIGQAQGILMAMLKISSEESFALLQRQSRRTNRKLREIAEEVVNTRTVPDPNLTSGGPGQADGSGLITPAD